MAQNKGIYGVKYGLVEPYYVYKGIDIGLAIC
jgi:hypothetical protein